MTLLAVRNLGIEFETARGNVRVVDSMSFEVNPGQVLAIVGESGSGKSVSALSLLGLLQSPPARIVSGSALFDGVDLLQADEETMFRVRGGRIGLVLQDPLSSLNPVMPIGRQIGETVERHLGLTRAQAAERAIELLDSVGIPLARERAHNYPHQLSGGMRQRAMIAMAIACEPALLIADEPTTALDVTIQAQIIDLIKRLRTRLGMAIIWITHDLGVVARLADRVLVMNAGRPVETADVRTLFASPQDAYTVRLINAVPRIDRPRRRR